MKALGKIGLRLKQAIPALKALIKKKEVNNESTTISTWGRDALAKIQESG